MFIISGLNKFNNNNKRLNRSQFYVSIHFVLNESMTRFYLSCVILYNDKLHIYQETTPQVTFNLIMKIIDQFIGNIRESIRTNDRLYLFVVWRDDNNVTRKSR